MKILVVEDRGETQACLEAYLTMNGCVTDHAGNGEGALTRLPLFLPDAVITDHIMPGKSGVELVLEMRATPAYAEIPVAIVSGIPESDIPILLAMVHGCSSVKVFAKPVDPAAILQWLREVTWEV